MQPPYRISIDSDGGDPARVLLCVDHGAAAASDEMRVHPGLRHLAGPAREWWLSPEPVRSTRRGRVVVRANRAVAMGHAHCDEARFGADPAGATEGLFAEVLDAIADIGHPRLLRTWVTIADIHRGEGDSERYRQFCVGRARVLTPASDGALFPAATVIGRDGGGLTLYFLAASANGEAIENPRQTSAYDYPQRYGPQPPSFVRALRCRWGDLLLSGTAAVVGHTSAHPHDCAQQTIETRHNVDSLLHAAGGTQAWQECRATAYLRHAEDLQHIGGLGLGSQTTVVAGAICRPELMVECEVVFTPQA